MKLIKNPISRIALLWAAAILLASWLTGSYAVWMSVLIAAGFHINYLSRSKQDHQDTDCVL